MVWVAIALGIYLVMLVGISLMFIRPFRTPVFISPGGMGAPQEDVVIKTADNLNLKGWWIDQPDSETVAIYVHGFMMNRCELTPLAVTLWQWGISGLVFDCRCHGKSPSARSGFGWTERIDLEAAVAYVRQRKPLARILLIGSSMGSASIAFAMGDNPDLADAAILDSCYGRLSRAVSGWWRFIGGQALAVVLWPCVLIAGPLAGLNPYRIDVLKSLKKIPPEKVLITHGNADTLALPSEAIRNAEVCGGADRIVWFEGCGHSEGRWVKPEEFLAAVHKFLEEHHMVDGHQR